MPQRVLLGPQRPHVSLKQAFQDCGIPQGPVAVVSAGWQEAEGDIDELRAHISRPLIGLELYQRAEQLFARELPLRTLYRERQDRLMELQGLYRLRLRQMLLAARQLRRSQSAADLLAAEERHAISQLRSLDRHHIKRTRAIHSEFLEASKASAAVEEQSEQIAAALNDCESVVITGGHVMVLLNRLQLFGLGEILASRHIVAWSAGAMVLSERVVLFHDRTPLGRRDPELLGDGLGLIPGFVFLPDALHRLRPKAKTQTGIFNRRFAPARCVTLDSGALLHLQDGRVCEARGVRCLSAAGEMTEFPLR